MLQDAETVRDDLSSYFVMLRFARDIAAGLDDMTTAVEAAEKLDATFQLDPVNFKLPWLKTAVENASTVDSLTVLYQQALTCHAEVLSRDDFSACSDLEKLVLQLARKLRDDVKIREATDLKERTTQARKAYQAVAPALHTLLRTPHDEAANAVVGRYLCLSKGDWARGILHLSKGNDHPLGSLASLELQNPQDPEGMVSLGDSYWELGTSAAKEYEKEALQQRASHWYLKASDQITDGLRKVLVRERLKQVQIRSVPAR